MSDIERDAIHRAIGTLWICMRPRHVTLTDEAIRDARDRLIAVLRAERDAITVSRSARNAIPSKNT